MQRAERRQWQAGRRRWKHAGLDDAEQQRIERLAERLLRENLPDARARVAWGKPGTGCHVRPGRRGSTLLLDSNQLARSPGMAEFRIGHEIGHIALGHLQPLALAARISALLLPVVVLAAGIVASVVYTSTGWLFAGVAAAVPLFLLLVRIVNQPAERACDEYAAAIGCHLPADALAAYRRTRDPFEERCAELVGSHPTWDQRLEVARRGEAPAPRR